MKPNNAVADLAILVPLCASGKYLDRARAFQKVGLLNAKKSRVHITALIGTDPVESFPQAWGHPAMWEGSAFNHVACKIYNHYASMHMDYIESARWFMRVDDDSVTDVDGLVEYLDSNFNYTEPNYFHAHTNYDNAPHYRMAMEDTGYGHLVKRRVDGRWNALPHEWECSVTSQAMMKRIFGNPDIRVFFGRLASYEGGFGDHGLAMAARMVKCAPSEVEFLAHDAPFDDFTGWDGGSCYHLHTVAPDIEENWNYLQQKLQENPHLLQEVPGGVIEGNEEVEEKV